MRRKICFRKRTFRFIGDGRHFHDQLERSARGRHGRVVYDLREDFGAEPAAVREPFRFYLERFAVRDEVM